MNYQNGEVPPKYFCSNCSAYGIKLWRQYQTFACNVDLLCADCAIKKQKKNFVIDEDGTYANDKGIRSDQIGWLVPAVPTEDEETFWGYASVPQNGVEWWKNLPLRLKGVE